MRWSRWGRSSYERDEDLAAERQAMAEIVEVLAPNQDAEVLSVPSKHKVDAAFLARVPSARLVITTTSGYDHFDIEQMKLKEIWGGRLPEARRDAVVDTALAMLLGGLRGLGPLRAAAAEGRWTRGALRDFGLRGVAGRPVGVVGLGVIGRQMARVLNALGAEVWGVDPAGVPEGVRAAPLVELFERCDAVTLHCGLSAESRGMVDAALLARARPDLVLVNTARGKLMDVDAAVEALRAGRLGALGVDVFPEEPYANLTLVQDLPGLVLTPHAAGWHLDLAARLREGLARSVQTWLQTGILPHRVC